MRALRGFELVDYLDFVPAMTQRGQIKAFIESDAGVQATEAKLYGVFSAWWQLHAPGLGELPKTKKVMELRAEFLSSFVDSLEPVGLLDRFKVAGVVASWWDEAIAHTSSLIAKLKHMKAGLLHDLLTRGLDENGELRDAIAHPEQFKDSPLGRIPKDWECGIAQLFCDEIVVGVVCNATDSYVDKGVPFLRSQNIRHGDRKFPGRRSV